MAQLAAIRYIRGFDIDRLLVDICRGLSERGCNIGGLVQISTGDRGGGCADTTHLVDLRSSRAFDIWTDRGPCARGCRLDEDGLALAEPVLSQAIADGVDLLVINRFGRAESQARGLRPYFEAAVTSDIAVLTAVREPYQMAWSDFHGGIGAELSPDAGEVLRWALQYSKSSPLPAFEAPHHL